MALRQDVPEKKPISEGKALISSKLRKVEGLALQDRFHDATKVLFSHGICKPSSELFDRLQSLHPPLKEEIPEIRVSVPKFFATNSDVYKHLFKNCTEHWDSMDPYGWNTALLHLVRNVSVPPDKGFFTLFSEFISGLILADVSDLVAFSL